MYSIVKVSNCNRLFSESSFEEEIFCSDNKDATDDFIERIFEENKSELINICCSDILEGYFLAHENGYYAYFYKLKQSQNERKGT